MQKQKLCTGPSRRMLTDTLIGLSIAMSVSMMMGCSTQTPPSSVVLPANLTSPAPSLTPLSDGKSGTVLRKLIEVSEMYYELQRKHQELVNACR